MTNEPKRRDLWRLSKTQLIAIIDWLDQRAGPADEDQAEPGIALSEAAIRAMIDEGGPEFWAESIQIAPKPGIVAGISSQMAEAGL